MRTLFLLLVAVLLGLVPNAATAAEEWKLIETTGKKELTSIACPEPRTCYIVAGFNRSGGTGAILKTTDGGDNFTLLSVPTSDPFQSVSCPSARVCYVVGDFGVILKTEDGGEKWTETRLGNKSNPPHFTAVAALDERTVVAAGRDTAFYYSEDGGNSWIRPAIRVVSDFFGIIFYDGKRGYLTGNGGTMLRTEDGGATWVAQGGLREATDLSHIRGSGTNLIAISEKLRRSVDKGATWATVDTGAQTHQSVAFSSGNTAYLIADHSTIRKSTDGGSTWKLETVPPYLYLRDIVCPAEGYCLAIGSSGKILRLGTPPVPPPTPVVEPAPIVATTTPAAPVVTSVPLVLPTQAAPQTVTVTPPVTPAPESLASDAIATALSRSLKRGSRGNNVMVLQELLARMGVFSKADMSDVFGPMTQKAVGKFQEQHGLASPGQPGYGEVGPKTRAKLIEVAKNGATAPSVSTPASAGEMRKPAVFTRSMKKGSRGEDVRRMQEILLSDAEISEGVEATGYFGPATAKAIGRFQEKHNIAFPGDDGYGESGPKTRAKLIELSR